MTTNSQVELQHGARGQRVLVAGATGYLGRHLVRALIDAGCQVRALVRRPEQAAALPDDPVGGAPDRSFSGRYAVAAGAFVAGMLAGLLQ